MGLGLAGLCAGLVQQQESLIDKEREFNGLKKTRKKTNANLLKLTRQNQDHSTALDVREFKQVINAEFNKSKFESDDSVERGPFAAVIALSSSHVNDSAEPGEDYAVHGMSDLGGSGQDMWFEESLFYVVQSGIFNRISSHFGGFKAGLTIQEPRTLLMDRLATLRGEFQKFFDPSFRKDGDLVTSWAQLSMRQLGRPMRAPEMAAILEPATISVVDGALNYSELSILRAGEFALPPSAKWGTQKALKFEVRTKNPNPVAVRPWNDAAADRLYLEGNGHRPFGSRSCRSDHRNSD